MRNVILCCLTLARVFSRIIMPTRLMEIEENTKYIPLIYSLVQAKTQEYLVILF